MSGQSRPIGNRHSDRVVAVISAYQPTHELVEHCAQLAPQVAKIVVVDDGSNAPAEEILNALISAGTEVVRHGENRGIGAAMNSGFTRARELGVAFVVTFDQDSAIPSGFVDALVDEFDRLNANGLPIGMVAPDRYSQTTQSQLNPGGEYLEAVAPIQSGLLIPISVIEKIGPQREDFFIDLIDTEYYFRLKHDGYIAACVPGLTLPHGFGNRVYIQIFGRTLFKPDGYPRIAAVSTPFRYYYRARNRVIFNWLYRKEFHTVKILLSQTINDLILDFSIAIWSSSKPFTMLSIMARGWFDGFRGRTGKAPPSVMHSASKIIWRHPVKSG